MHAGNGTASEIAKTPCFSQRFPESGLAPDSSGGTGCTLTGIVMPSLMLTLRAIVPEVSAVIVRLELQGTRSARGACLHGRVRGAETDADADLNRQPGGCARLSGRLCPRDSPVARDRPVSPGPESATVRDKTDVISHR